MAGCRSSGLSYAPPLNVSWASGILLHKLANYTYCMWPSFLDAAPRLITVSLNPPNIQESQVNVVVKNGRLDQQNYLDRIWF